MKLASLLALAAVASLGVESQVSVAPRRRCAWCKSPSNRCPCAVCGACTTDGGAPGAVCGCGRGRGAPAVKSWGGQDCEACGGVCESIKHPGQGCRGPSGATGPVGCCNPDNRTPLTYDQVAAGAWPGPTGPVDDGGRT